MKSRYFLSLCIVLSIVFNILCTNTAKNNVENIRNADKSDLDNSEPRESDNKSNKGKFHQEEEDGDPKKYIRDIKSEVDNHILKNKNTNGYERKYEDNLNSENDDDINNFKRNYAKAAKNAEKENNTSKSDESENNGKPIAESKSYCQLKCDTEHIGCIGNKDFGKNCPKNVQLLPIRNEMHSILQIINEERNRVAGGEREPLAKAVSMSEMVWNDELAWLAELQAKTCQLDRNKCYNTNRFPKAGQSMGSLKYRGLRDSFSDSILVKRMLDGWMQSKGILMEYVKEYPSDCRFNTYLSLINDRNTHIGCAAVRYYEIKGDVNIFLMICNFAVNNIRGHATYKSGYKVASRCTDISESYKNLCAPKRDMEI